MTVSAQPTLFQYVGNGVTTVFAYNCQVLQPSDLNVYVNGVAVTSGITKGGIGSLTGGTVTFSVAPANGAQVILEREVVLERTTDYQQNGDFLSRVVNPDFNRIWMALQQLMTGFSRALKVPKTDVSPITELPPAATRANNLLGFDASGNPITVAPNAQSATALQTLYATSAGSSLIGFIQAGVGAILRTLQSKSRDIINVRDFGAVGDGVTDDTAAIQAAINYVRTRSGATLYFPAQVAGQFYKTTAPLTCDGSITIVGDGMHAVIIIATGLSAGQYVLDFNLPLASNYYFNISGITLRSNNALPKALRLTNTSYVVLKNVQFYNVADGAVFSGGNTFSNYFDNVVGYQITRNTVRFEAFNGGGQYAFSNCTFTGDEGFYLHSDSATNNLSITNTNFEQCVTTSLSIAGTVEGLNLAGCRTEGSNLNDFVLNQAVGKSITGISITGCYFSSDTVASRPVQLGGTGGKVRGFNISGNHVSVATGAMVTLNGEGESGVISGNYLATATATPTNTQRAGVEVFGNENTAGKCAEYWGTATWDVKEGTFTPTDASGAGLSFAAASGRYTKIGRQVHWHAYLLFPATANGAATDIAGLPFAVNLSTNVMGRAGARVDLCNVGSAIGVMQGYSTTTRFSFWNPTALTQITNATLSGKELYISGTYFV